ncbi:hypothetical protein GF108_01195 [Phyllobacterium sp. SYP-B3895]|uniref:hypothetical protein n=1 Tax=Phyllobacterium sp. SYP-B3895 TaxID=2663240 RepID=UPI001299CB20|nr:hypothetical protein [Phyllobacterium sp. SYP-B3895]MRG54198.1 hypothetical protein [Phyllobacterium sp. SYP-B3895]
MFRILTLASPLLAFAIGSASAEDTSNCPNAAELINKPGVNNVELAKAIKCLTKGLDKQSTDKTKTSAGAIIQLANKIIGNGSPAVAPTNKNVGMLAAAVSTIDPQTEPKATDPNREHAGNIICQASVLRSESPFADSRLPKDFKCADMKEPADAIIQLANKIIGNG